MSTPAGHDLQRAEAHLREAARWAADGRTEEALAACALALHLAPESPSAWSDMGVVLRAANRPAAAEACYRRALALDPQSAGAWTNLGNVLRPLGRLKEAAECHRQALRLAPDMASAWHNLGLVLSDQGRGGKAILAFDKALALDPAKKGPHWDRALALLRLGRLKEGFREYEHRFDLPEMPPRVFRQPRWDGSPLDGRTLLVHAEQGFGDAILFSRFLAPAAARAAGEAGPFGPEKPPRIILECRAELVGLLRGVAGVSEVVCREDRLPDFDVEIPLLSLPLVLGLDEISPCGGYISPPADVGFPLHVPPGTRLKVGICWAGSPTHANDANRSVGLERFLQLASSPGVVLYSLQKGPRAADREALACGALVRELAGGCRDFGETAKAMAQLDLVVGVDTAVVHLAGALGLPVRTLLPFAADWRWFEGREDSPWYPSMRLVRQKAPGDWDGVFGRVLEEVRGLAGQRG